MSDGPKPEEEKIIIDEDWKSQVEAEKEAAREKPSPKSAEAPADQDVPPPTLTFLAGGFYLQGMISLGLLSGPNSDKPEPDLPQAKHAIDTLDMLYAKTEGNRTPEESQEMDRMLHELRLAYVGRKDAGGEGGMMNDE